MNGVCTVISFIAVFSIASLSWASDLKIVHIDPEWKNGEGNVPEKGICSKHGGGNLTPSLGIRGIPTSSKTLRFMFTDDDHGDEGGHGDFTLQLSGQGTVKIPSFADNSLPPGMIGGNGHHCSNCDETDYLGPCSGGKGHSYRVNIYARDGKKNVIAKGTVRLGNF